MALDLVLPSVSSELLVSDVLEDFLTDCRVRNLSPRTVKWYAETLPVVLAPVYNIPLASVSLRDLKAAIAGLIDGRSPATVNGFVRAAKAFLNWAEQEGLLVQVDARRLPRLKEPRRLPPTLSAEQIGQLLSAPNTRTFVGLRDHTLMSMMLDTGVRLGEVRSALAAHVSVPFVRVCGKGDKERTVAMSPPMQAWMRKYLRGREKVLQQAEVETPYLFPSRSGGQLSARHIQERVADYAKAAGVTGVRVSPHTCRYTFATHFLRNGGSIVALQQILGHTTLAMSRRYAAMVDEDAFEEGMRCSPLAAEVRV